MLLRLFVLAAVLGLSGGPALAQCLTRSDLSQGILFDRQGAGTGRVIALSEEAVQIDYDFGRNGYTDRRDMAHGVFETAVLRVSAPPDVIGVWSERTDTRDYVGRFPAIGAGTSWQTTINTRWENSDFSGVPQSRRERYFATYAFLAPIEATLSGCTYAVISVEMRLQGGDTDLTRRYAFFPALGTAIETQVTNHVSGAVSTYGITALRAVP